MCWLSRERNASCQSQNASGHVGGILAVILKVLAVRWKELYLSYPEVPGVTWEKC